MASMFKSLDWIDVIATPTNKRNVSRLNFLCLLLCTYIFSHLYTRSVQPVTLEKKYGKKGWALAGRLRHLSFEVMTLAIYHFIKYSEYPIDHFHSKKTFPKFMNIPKKFPWSRKISIAMAVLISLPATVAGVKSVLDAGMETAAPSEDTELVADGVYKYVRHPQTLSELPVWFVIGLLTDSPFLFMLSFSYIPLWYWFCLVEERDLILRFGDKYKKYQQKTGFWFPKWEQIHHSNLSSLSLESLML